MKESEVGSRPSPDDLPPIELIPEFGSDLLRTLILLVVLLVGAIVVLWAIRRFIRRDATRGGKGLIRVLEVRRFEAGRALYVVETDNHRLLLGVGEGGWSKLARLGDPTSTFDPDTSADGTAPEGPLGED